jgi:hypothetical protein
MEFGGSTRMDNKRQKEEPCQRSLSCRTGFAFGRDAQPSALTQGLITWTVKMSTTVLFGPGSTIRASKKYDHDHEGIVFLVIISCIPAQGNPTVVPALVRWRIQLEEPRLDEPLSDCTPGPAPLP